MMFYFIKNSSNTKSLELIVLNYFCVDHGLDLVSSTQRLYPAATSRINV